MSMATNTTASAVRRNHSNMTPSMSIGPRFRESLAISRPV
jgi:hypothetical protein